MFLVANLVHYWSPTQSRALLRRIRDAASSGARLLLADFWTDRPTHTEPVHAALMAGEFAVHVRYGDVYSVNESLPVAARGRLVRICPWPALRA